MDTAILSSVSVANLRIRNENREMVDYCPKSANGLDIKVSDKVSLPEPQFGESWKETNLVCTVVDCDEITGDIIAMDASGDFHVIEPGRLNVI